MCSRSFWAAKPNCWMAGCAAERPLQQRGKQPLITRNHKGVQSHSTVLPWLVFFPSIRIRLLRDPKSMRRDRTTSSPAAGSAMNGMRNERVAVGGRMQRLVLLLIRRHGLWSCRYCPLNSIDVTEPRRIQNSLLSLFVPIMSVLLPLVTISHSSVTCDKVPATSASSFPLSR